MKYSNRYNLPECEVCPRQGNKLACLLYSCQAREIHDYQVIKGWYTEWVRTKNCFSCKHHKVVEYRDNGCTICKLTGELTPLAMTCDRYEERPWDPEQFMREEAMKNVESKP